MSHNEEHSSQEWIVLFLEWAEAEEQFIRAERDRERLFAKFKVWAGTCTVFGNLHAVPSMIEQEIGRAILRERP